MSHKNNKFIVLPHVNTLKKYTNFVNPSSGFNKEIIERLIIDSNLANLEPWQKNVSIIFDEMKVKSDLVYSRATGKLIGFTDMGDINEEVRKLQGECGDESPEKREMTRYVNVFMVRGIFTKLVYPFGYFGSPGLSGEQLFPCALEATRILERIGFKVRAWICDGASPNRKLFKLCESFEDGDTTYWTTNPFDHSRKIFFFSDFPHLLKTTRNNLENSHGNLNTRNLHVSYTNEFKNFCEKKVNDQ